MVKSTLLPPSTRRAALSLILACAMMTGLTLFVASRRAAVTSARLHSAERELEALTDGPSEAIERAAVAWGYAERMRLGLESPFRLIEAASRDPRLTLDERRTVSWALLATLLRGESHQVDAAALDRLMRGSPVRGEAHIELIDAHILNSGDPRSAELGVRMAYALAAAERVIDASALPLIAQAAALIADREIGRREAGQLLRGSTSNGTIAAIAQARRERELYVERPVLMSPSRALEQQAIALVPDILKELRVLTSQSIQSEVIGAPLVFQATLQASASRVHPAAAITVTGKRFLPVLRAQLSESAVHRIAQAHNAEMLAAALTGSWSREQRTQLGRMHLAAAVAMRAHAQEPIWFPGDSVPTIDQLGVASVSFDAGVPPSWRPYYLTVFASGIRTLKTVFPQLKLDGIDIRFRAKSPADSALAMHEPRTRTLHLPVATVAGTLAHEIAHDLDRQMSLRQGRAGYWSDAASRGGDGRRRGSANRVAASLRAMTEETSEGRGGSGPSDRPAEIFATRVDWFVAQSLARQGRASGFISAVQDELLTGHVLHTERLRGSSRSRSLLTALEGMTPVAAFARIESPPTAYSMMQYVLRVPLERRSARSAAAMSALTVPICAAVPRDPAGLMRLAAASRALGIVRARAESMAPHRRPTWARAALGEAPWSPEAADAQVQAIASELLGQLSTPGLLQVGVGSRVDALVRSARCED